MGLFKSHNKGGLMDVIRCEESSYLVWKWHPEGSALGKNTRENAIRWGSSLRVKGSEAVSLSTEAKMESIRDFIIGSYDEALKAERVPSHIKSSSEEIKRCHTVVTVVSSLKKNQNSVLIVECL